MKKLIFICLLIGTALGVYFVSSNPKNSGTLPVVSRVSTPKPVVQNSPVKLSIPKIGVNANVEAIGLDSQKRMDVPKSWEDVGWLKTGYYPGEIGNAVIDGHLDSPTAPAVFWNLKKINVGDEIRVTDSKNNILTFIVVRKVAYPYNNFPLNDVFGVSDKPMLNLITCEGVWDPSQKIYSDRLVVFSQLVSSGNNKQGNSP